MKKRMLITGASHGIGQACAEYFNNTYEVITVARNGSVTIKGDLTDEKFVRELVSSVKIDVLLNNAGLLSTDLLDTFKLNVMAACYLAGQYYETMTSGHIINLCSTASHMRGWKDMPLERIWYISSKAALKDFGVTLQNSRRKNVKVTNLEPGWVNTEFAGEKADIPTSEYINQTHEMIPMQTHDIARTIDWILQQPEHIVIHTLQLDNFRINNVI